MSEITKEISTIENVNQLVVFPIGQVDRLVDVIEKEVLSIVPDTTTAKGRKEIASTAYKVAQSKTYLDNLAVKCKEEAQAKVKAVDAERRGLRDRLDLLKTKVREPLTLWEDAEKKRIEEEKAEQEYNAAFDEAIKEHDLYLRNKAIEEKEAALAKEEAERKAKEEKRIADEKAEADRLQAEKEAKERDEKLKRKAAEAATREAEERARKEKEEREKAEKERAEKERVEREKIEAERIAAIKAKDDAIKAQEAERAKAKADAEKAAKEAEEKRLRDIQAEKDRAEAERLAAEKARKEAERVEKERLEKELAIENARKANLEHRRSVNKSILSDLVKLGVSEDVGREVVIAAASGGIKNLSINY
jgi:hypothetical protein